MMEKSSLISDVVQRTREVEIMRKQFKTLMPRLHWIQMTGWDALTSAVEAGPLLVEKGACCIDMEQEGWKTLNSIHTQAARLDFTDMRGPKIAIGLDVRGNLSVVCIRWIPPRNGQKKGVAHSP